MKNIKWECTRVSGTLGHGCQKVRRNEYQVNCNVLSINYALATLVAVMSKDNNSVDVDIPFLVCLAAYMHNEMSCKVQALSEGIS